MVYKRTTGGAFPKTQEAEYNGNNISSITWTEYNNVTEEYVSKTTNFIYDMTTPVKGEFINDGSNRYGNNNPVIYLDSFGFLFGIENYMINRINFDGSVSEIQYQFDNDGYPIKQTIYRNGELESEFLITYQ